MTTPVPSPDETREPLFVIERKPENSVPANG
jgi:hypothetical protein